MIIEKDEQCAPLGIESGLRSATASNSIRSQSSAIDLWMAVLSLALFTLWIYTFRYQRSLGEDDLYRVLCGLLDGARSGSGLASPLHYGKAFSFGYIAALYHFADPKTLLDPLPLMALMNSIGFCAAVAGSVCFWLSTRLLYGARAASVALALFALSPMMLEVGTSGHQILVAFALFSAASVLLFLPLRGLPYVAASALAAMVLLAALVSRAEIFLALPFLVLAKTRLGPVSQALKSAAIRSIAPGAAFAAFLVLKHIFVDSAPGKPAESGSFFDTFYSLSNIPRGVLVYLLGCGLITTIASIFAAFRIFKGGVGANLESQPGLLESAIGPLALILPALAFWIANPLPARHFILCLAGMGILSGLLAAYSAPSRPITAYGLVFGCVLANQAFGALSGSFILRHYPSPLVNGPGRRAIMPRVPIGSSFSFHNSVQSERWRADTFAESIRHSCDAKTLVIGDRQRQVFSHLYESPAHWISGTSVFHRFGLISANDGTREYLVLSPHEGWPGDAVAKILADPSLGEYKLVRDPETISIYDKTAIPPQRAARLDCAAY